MKLVFIAAKDSMYVCF